MNKNSFALTPPMGWNSYDYYDTSVNEAQVRANAEYMAKNLKQYGWQYVVIDIEWYANDAGTQRERYQYIPFGDLQMDEYSRLQPAPARFPSSADGTGFRQLAEYVHSLGLKFGIHIMRGIPRKAAEQHCAVLGTDARADEIADPSSICPWNPDMYGVRDTPAGQAYYDALIAMYAEWGVDFIKCDDICDSRLYRDENWTDQFSGWHETRMLHEAIMKSGRKIVLSLSPGPAHIDRAWQYCEYANMWRITDDFWDNWELLKNMFWRCEMWQDHVRQGCFPDCDMLPLGMLGGGFGHGEWQCRFTREEQKTMMTLWCMFRSPLMVGAELTRMDDWTLSLLTNEELLALMDEHCRGTQIVRNERAAVWVNENSDNGALYVALFNLSDAQDTLSVSLDSRLAADKSYTLHELWDKTDSTMIGNTVQAVVAAHGVKVFRVRMLV